MSRVLTQDVPTKGNEMSEADTQRTSELQLRLPEKTVIGPMTRKNMDFVKGVLSRWVRYETVFGFGIYLPRSQVPGDGTE